MFLVFLLGIKQSKSSLLKWGLSNRTWSTNSMKWENKNWSNVDQYSWLFHIHPSVPASSLLKSGYHVARIAFLENQPDLPSPNFCLVCWDQKANHGRLHRRHLLLLPGALFCFSSLLIPWLLFLKMIMKQQRKTKKTQPLLTHRVRYVKIR